MKKKAHKPKEKMFNGKPMSYWERESKKAVVEVLVRGSLSSDARSIIGEKMSRRLMELALLEDRFLTLEVLQERDVCLKNLHGFLTAILPDHSPFFSKAMEAAGFRYGKRFPKKG